MRGRAPETGHEFLKETAAREDVAEDKAATRSEGILTTLDGDGMRRARLLAALLLVRHVRRLEDVPARTRVRSRGSSSEEEGLSEVARGHTPAGCGHELLGESAGREALSDLPPTVLEHGKELVVLSTTYVDRDPDGAADRTDGQSAGGDRDSGAVVAGEGQDQDRGEGRQDGEKSQPGVEAGSRDVRTDCGTVKRRHGLSRSLWKGRQPSTSGEGETRREVAFLGHDFAWVSPTAIRRWAR